jgi:glutathione synthase/RimK-type ligase-like ATP-grasp enzyme
LIAFVTEPGAPELRDDDRLVLPELAARGLAAEAVPWGAPLDPARHTLAVLRTPWDYTQQLDTFLAWCDAAPVPLLNPAPLVRWNAHKRYLLELERSGAARLSPTVVLQREDAAERPSAADLAHELHGRGSDDPLRRLVVKPAVSAGARGTFVLDPAAPDAEALLDAAVRAADVLVQRYERRLVERGEWSLLFFAGAYSHAVRKRPRAGDFRVQANHGGTLAAAEPPPRLVADARRLVGRVGGPDLLYARVDGFEGADGGFVLVELELIEPELFLRCGGAAAWATALAGRCG